MSQEPLPVEIIDDARARQRAGDGELTPAQVKKIARQLREGIAQLPPEQYKEKLRERLREIASEQDVELPHPDTRSAFWSYKLEEHPDIGVGEDLYSMHVAAAYAEAEESVRYLEGTPGGKALGELHLWDPAVRTALKLDKDSGRELAGDAWSALSQKYATRTENEALFFMAELNPGTVAYQTEAPQLREDGKLDIIRFMYPPPSTKLEGFPPETQELLSRDAVRAQLHTFAYDEKANELTKAGYLNLDVLRSLPTPEAQRAAVLELCAGVARLDGREADVEKLTEEVLTLRAEQEAAAPGIEEQEQQPQKEQAQQAQQAQEARQTQAAQEVREPQPTPAGHTTPAPPTVSTPAPVTVSAPAPAPAAAATPAPASPAFNFMPGVTVTPKQVVPAGHGVLRPTEQAPPAAAKAHDTDMGM
ncbi:hypothetical protein ABZ612_07585 [Streptomyces avermitilis]|uniref:hypothetical protein n=1 Tax=Streptomyces avermitilis TaxID=33903 RepID=UPI0033F40312